MSKLINKVPDFLYKPAAINPKLLSKIQKECLELFKKMNQLAEKKNKGAYYVRLQEKNDLCVNIAKYCPVLTIELKRLKIFHLFNDLLFLQTAPSDIVIDMPIHRDYNLDNKYIFGHFGLNIPVVGCENTYTVFYTGDIDKHKQWSDNIVGTDNALLAELADENTIVEIDRVESNKPLWINNYAWHKAEYTLGTNRMVLSIRFEDMQHLFDNGYFDQHLVAKETTLTK